MNINQLRFTVSVASIANFRPKSPASKITPDDYSHMTNLLIKAFVINAI